MAYRMHTVCLLSAAITLSVGCAAPKPAGFFPISYWCPPPAEDARYREARECGFNLAFFGEPNLAQKYGMKCLVGDPRVAAAVDKPGPGTDTGLDEAVKQYARHPAFWGFYLMDEPGAGKFADLAHVNQHLLGKDPNCVPYINLFPTYASEKQLGTKTYEEHIERFMNEVKPRVLSYDHYALLKDGTERPDYFRNMEIIRTAGLKYDVPYWYIFLITPHYGYRDPSEGDVRWQVYTALAYGYKGLLYFTYAGVKAEGFGESILDLKGQRTKRYDLAKKVNAEINALGPLLAGLRSTAVYHIAARLPDGARGPDADSLVRRAEGGDLVVGELQDAKGKRYLFLTNASPHKPATFCVTLADGAKIKGEVPRGPKPAEKVVAKDKAPVLKIDLAAGDGRLLCVSVR
jgi:hypothetical protein